MLNPPLSLLCNELLASIVEHLYALPYSLEAIRNLSLTDRAFTPYCQNVIFRTLHLGSDDITKTRIPYQLEKFQTILNEKPSVANQVRFIHLFLLRTQNEWEVLNDPTFIRILNLITKSPSPPDRLEFVAVDPIDNPVLLVGVLARSFFSQSLRFLEVFECENLPLPLLLICPRLQVVIFYNVAVAVDSYDGYQDDQCAREWPSLQVFHYRYSHSYVEQMITPPPRFQAPVTLWSQLRILKLCPHLKDDLAYLQPILDAACNSLEELNLDLPCDFDDQKTLAGFVNLSNLSNLRVFSLIATIEGNASERSVLRDINTVLSRIPSPNNITNMFFEFTIWGPFGGCLDEDWAGLHQQIIRIAADKPLELDFQMGATNGREGTSGETSLLLEKVVSLSDCPNICTHFWNPTLGKCGLKTVYVSSKDLLHPFDSERHVH